MKYLLLLLLAITAVATPARAIDLMDDAITISKPVVSLVMPAPKAKLVPDQVMSSNGGINGMKALAYGVAFVGGVSLGYGLSSLLIGGSADGRHNEAIVAGGVLIGLSFPLAIIADKQQARSNAPAGNAGYRKHRIKTQLCIAANKNGLGLALNF